MQVNELKMQINSLEEIDFAAKKIVEFIADVRIVLFNADMGAGKTTLIKSICKALGSIDNFGSPTYSIVNEYTYPKGKIFHFDLYRIKSTEELFDLGVEDYLSSQQYCFVEWPQKMIDIIDSDYMEIEIKTEENIRYIRAFKICK